MTTTPAQLLTASLLEVFGERDPARRRAAMQRTFAAGVTFHDPEGTGTGHEALEARIEALYAGAPPDWAFQAAAPAAEAADLGRATWTFGPPDGPKAVRGMDIGIIADGQIVTMYTIVEPDLTAPKATAREAGYSADAQPPASHSVMIPVQLYPAVYGSRRDINCPPAKG